jgi:hypothetical protein
MSIAIKASSLTADMAGLAQNYGLKLNDDELIKLTVRVAEVLEAVPTKTVYVVTCDPEGSVGGFDWFWNKSDAVNRENYCRRTGYKDTLLDEVQVPANFEVGDTQEVTDWLDGFWYDR